MTTKTPPKAPTMSAKPIEFWDALILAQQEVASKGYGDTSGKGGSYMKDSNALKKDGNTILAKYGITFTVDAHDVGMRVVDGTTHLIVSGTFLHKWFYKNELVHQGSVFASFNNTLGGRGESSAQVTTGAVTNATTIIMYDMLKANTQSEEEFIAKAEVAKNAQDARPAAVSKTSGDTAGVGRYG